jgi:O-succinylbenzoic acid--CoA ligase
MDFSFLRAAEEAPDRLALISDGVPYRYAELAPRVRRTMTWLLTWGIRPELPDCRVALVGSLRLDTVIAIWALVELGVPVVLIHPKLTAPERQRLFDDCSPQVVLDENWHAPTDGAEAASRAPVPDDGRCLAILYTSGTSGRPKGAILSRRAFAAAASASAMNLGWRDDDRWMLCMPLAHVGGLSILLRCLRARRTVISATRSSFSADGIAMGVEENRATLISLVPTMLKRMLELDPPWEPPAFLRCILLGGAACPERTLREAARRNLPVLTTYGMTEACSQIASQRLGTPPSPEEGAGHPLPGVEVRIVEEHVQVRGPNLMSGYFPPGVHPSPFTEDGWLQTGDLGHLDDQGRLHLLARRKDLIISGGENVYPVEVEQTLETHPSLAQALVFGVADETWGQRVAAALVASGDPPADEALLAFIQERLAAHKRPKQVAFLPSLPVNHTGKIDRAAAIAAATPLLRSLKKTGRA